MTKFRLVITMILWGLLFVADFTGAKLLGLPLLSTPELGNVVAPPHQVIM